MSKIEKSLIIQKSVIIILLFGSNVFGFPRGMIMGEVKKIDNKKVVILNQDSIEKELSITSGTVFLKDIPIGKEQLKKGDNLLVIGERDAKNTIKALLIKSLYRKEEAVKRPQGFGGPPRDGPVMGTVTETKPLKLKLGSGEIVSIEFFGFTQIMQEVRAQFSDIRAGQKVRIQFSDVKGFSEALKIIIIDEDTNATGERTRIKRIPLPHKKISALKYLNSPFGFLNAPPSVEYFADLDVHWSATGFKLGSWEDIEKEKGEYDFSVTDSEIRYLYENGINLFVELRPINRLYGSSFTERGPGKDREYPKGHLGEYIKFVKKFVERYDGDKFEDAPGSPIIRYYQFVHELSPPMAKYPDFWRRNPGKYALMYKLLDETIKKACPDCKLFLPGATLKDYQEGGFIPSVLAVFKEKGWAIKNIGFDYHYWSLPKPGMGPLYSEGEDYRKHREYIQTIKSCYRKFGYDDNDVEILSREVGMAGLKETERAQASYLVKIYVLSLSLGQKKLFWTTTLEYGHIPPQRQDVDIFAHTGLINNPRNKDGLRHKKLSYYTYKLMVKKLEYSDWDNIETLINGKDNLYSYRFLNKKSGKPITVMWWDGYPKENKNHQGKNVVLSVNAKKVTVTNAIPDAENGSEIRDRVIFKTEVKESRNGKVSILLQDSPVFIEEGSQSFQRT